MRDNQRMLVLLPHPDDESFPLGGKARRGPVASIDITDYRLPKWRAMQAHASQTPPFQGKPEEKIENIACHEYFTLARPSGNFADTEDLFALLKEIS